MLPAQVLLSGISGVGDIQQQEHSSVNLFYHTHLVTRNLYFCNMVRLLILLVFISQQASGQLNKTYGVPYRDGFTYHSINFEQDGTYVNTFSGCIGDIVTKGKYMLEKDRLTMINDNGSAQLPDTTYWRIQGRRIYRVGIAGKKHYLIEEKYVKDLWDETGKRSKQ